MTAIDQQVSVLENFKLLYDLLGWNFEVGVSGSGVQSQHFSAVLTWLSLPFHAFVLQYIMRHGEE